MEIEDRKRLLEIALRRVKIGTGSLLSELCEKRGGYKLFEYIPDFPGIRYLIVGGLATALYMPQRMTLDIDILILSDDLDKAENLLSRKGARRLGPLNIGGSAWQLANGNNLDLIALDQPWVHDALALPVRDDSGHLFAALPYLVLMKLESGRLQDLADISRMLGYATEEQVEAVRVVVARNRPQDMDDLESMIFLGRMEHEE